jgi:hypothetical protein
VGLVMGMNRIGLVQHVLFVGIEELELIDRRVLELIQFQFLRVQQNFEQPLRRLILWRR